SVSSLIEASTASPSAPASGKVSRTTLDQKSAKPSHPAQSAAHFSPPSLVHAATCPRPTRQDARSGSENSPICRCTSAVGLAVVATNPASGGEDARLRTAGAVEVTVGKNEPSLMNVRDARRASLTKISGIS